MNQTAQKTAETKDKQDVPLPVKDARYLLNRELSWLEFNRRVLEEALDDTNPLLERLKFLSIFSTNLDEFFMIRVAGLKEQVAEGVTTTSRDGMTPAEQLREIRLRLLPMLEQQSNCLHADVLPKLADNGIKIYQFKDLSKGARKKLDDYFLKNVFPVLTPQAVDESHPFPYVSNLSLNVGLAVSPDKNVKHGKLEHLYNRHRFVRIKMPPALPRLIPCNEKETHFALLGEVVGGSVDYLFPNMPPHKSHLFRLTRDADIELREDESDDLLSSMERQLHQRHRFTFPLRLEISPSMPDDMVRFLTRSISYLTGTIGLTEADVYRTNGFLNIPDLMTLYSLDRPDLKDQPIHYSIPKLLRKKENVFETIKKQDVLLHHPYTSFSAVTDFVDEAAEDEQVSAIKICLYRTGKNSPIVKSLIKANQNGKQVAVLVELKARFDEENNIEWARRLEDEGIHVIYGMRGLKTHSKVTLVVRNEDDGMRRYVHLATGNYNPTTSKIYTDLGILTADEEIGADASDLFNFLTGYSYKTDFNTLLVAPVNLRERMLELVEREIKHRKHDKESRIIVKINSLTDDKIVRALYRASQAGVKIDLIVRGICVLRPGIEGISENIRVVSITGRFLEHSRIFYFSNDGDEEIYIGSADWMHRNLDRRVEAAVPIKDRQHLKYVRDKILDAYLRDNVNARVLKEDGTYEKIQNDKQAPFDSQMYFAEQEI
ncbi:MAG TPA: polyphosphate kinase 1 [Pyrinomonadaceae bacterium]|nr:polyphosphate kinase 1 [Pyrinomonadaceae bacterium]